jgi:hypothetical protein
MSSKCDNPAAENSMLDDNEMVGNCASIAGSTFTKKLYDILDRTDQDPVICWTYGKFIVIY